METLIAVAALAIAVPGVFKLAELLGEWTAFVRLLKKINAL